MGKKKQEKDGGPPAPDEYLYRVARAVQIPVEEAAQRFEVIAADPELRRALFEVLAKIGPTTVVTEARRNEKGDIEVSVASDPGSGTPKQAQAGIDQMRREIASFELSKVRRRAPVTALPLLAPFLLPSLVRR